jgi:hypothetical protein
MIDKSTHIINQVAGDKEVKGGYTSCVGLRGIDKLFSEGTPFETYHTGR